MRSRQDQNVPPSNQVATPSLELPKGGGELGHLPLEELFHIILYENGEFAVNVVPNNIASSHCLYVRILNSKKEMVKFGNCDCKFEE
jgi:hypothetical protein